MRGSRRTSRPRRRRRRRTGPRPERYVAAMDRAEASRIAHGDLRLWNPLSERAIDEAIELLDLAPGATVLDVAAGRGEVLRRVSARWDVRGTGYDSDPRLVEGTGLELRDAPPGGPFDLIVC